MKIPDEDSYYIDLKFLWECFLEHSSLASGILRTNRFQQTVLIMSTHILTKRQARICFVKAGFKRIHISYSIVQLRMSLHSSKCSPVHAGNK